MAQYGTAKYGSYLYGSTTENPHARVSGKVMWMVQVDWDGDGVFGSEIEPQTMRSLSIRRGRRSRIAADGRGQVHPGNESFDIEFTDSVARYDIFNTSSPIYSYMGAPGLLLRVLMVSTTSKAAFQTVFVGTLISVGYDAKTGIGRLSGEGLSRWLEIGAAASIYAPCQSFSLSAWDSWFISGSTTPTPFNYWKGRTGGLTLRSIVATVLERAGWGLGAYYGARVYNNEQPDYFYLDGASAWDTLTDLANGFAGRLFFLRDGRLFVMDRLDPDGMHTGLAAPTRAQEEYGLERTSPFDSLRNRAEVNIRPHSVMPFNNPVTNSMYQAAWTNAGPIEVAPDSYVDIKVKYSGDVLQGSFVRVNTDALTESTPMAAWSKADKTGTNMGAVTGSGAAEFSLITQQIGENSFGLTYVQDGNNQSFCTVRLRNYSATLTAFFFDLQVQVVGVRETGMPGSVIVENAASIAANGARVITVDNRWIQNKLMADGIGQAYVDALSDRERASAATIMYQWGGDTLYANLVNYDLGSYVDFGLAGGADALANFGLSGRWLIIGQEIRWMSADGQDARVSMTYEREALVNVLLVGSSGAVGVGVPSLTWSHTVVDGKNRALVVVVCKRAFSGTAAVQSIKYGGVSLTLRGAVQEGIGDYPAVEMWDLKAPAVGTANLVLTLASGVEYMQVGAFNFVNVNQTTALGAPAYDWGAAGPGSCLATAESGDLVLDGICHRNADATAGAGQTREWGDSSDGTWKGAASTKPGITGVNDMRWTVPSGGFAQMAVAIRHA